MHGTSAIFANILCKKPFSITRPILNRIGYYAPILDLIFQTRNKFVYSSRSVLKNRRDGNYTEMYGVLLQQNLRVKFQNVILCMVKLWDIPPVVRPSKSYDYGVAKGECEFRVYRITCNLPEGKIYELEWYEIEEFCHDLGLKTVQYIILDWLEYVC